MKVISIFILALLLVSSYSKASHVMGGHFEVVQLSGRNYQINFIGQMDCQNGVPGFGFDPSRVRVFDKATDAFIQYIDLTVGTLTIDTVSLGDNCYNPGLCVEEWRYSTQVNLPSSTNGLYLTYDICCRNSIINNIIFPHFNGHTFYIEIPPNVGSVSNSSPVFQPYNIDAYFCLDRVKCYDLSGVDPDGDELRYSIVTPLDEDSTGKPFDTIVWAGSHTTNDPLNSNVFYIDSLTGMLCAQASSFGVFVFSVLVEEYRAGVKIGEVTRDFQWDALNCQVGSPIQYPFLNDTQVAVFDEEFCMDIVAEDLSSPNDTLIIQFDGNILDLNSNHDLPSPIQLTPPLYEFNYIDNVSSQSVRDTIEGWRNNFIYEYKGLGKVGFRLCWTPDECYLYDIDSIYLNLETHSNRCVGSDTIRRRVNFKVTHPPVLSRVPNVFSPNGDGDNDVYKLTGIYHRCYDVLHAEIYNRWGLKVYETDDPNFEWNGKNVNDKDLEPGSYFVLLQGYYGGEEVTSQFPVTLFR